MFASKVAKPQTKAAEGPTSRLASHRSTLVGHRFGYDLIEQALFLQRTIGNQATLRLLAQRDSAPPGNGRNSGEEQESVGEKTLIETAPRGVSWDFSKIPVFPPDRSNRPQVLFPATAPLLPGGIQAQLVVGSIDDPLEHEADRVADQVMHTRAPGISAASLQPAVTAQLVAGRNNLIKRQIKRQWAVRDIRQPDSCETTASPGQPLDHATRAFMEPRFGYDFSQVRVHANEHAAASARALGALAYTVGPHIAFADGRYEPTSQAGRRLLAHELAHVVQQTGPVTNGRSAQVGMTKKAYLQRNDEQADQMSDQTSYQSSDIVAGDKTVLPVNPDQRDGDAEGYIEEVEEFTPVESDETDLDLPAQYIGDGNRTDQGTGVQPMVAAPAPRFVDLGRVGTARYGDPLTPYYHRFAHAFTDSGRTATVKWAGGGGAGAHGIQPTGSIQKQVLPRFFQTSPKADAWVRDGTGKIDVIRSWAGVNGGDQLNGFFLTAAAAARINLHETLHVSNTQGHYKSDIDPLLTRVSSNTMSLAVAKVLKSPAAPRSIPALKAIIQWSASITRFQTSDRADNRPTGTVDTTDLASGTYPVDIGPGTVAGKAFNHRIRTPGEPNPPP